MMMIRLGDRFSAGAGRHRRLGGTRALATLTVAVCALTGGSSALAATAGGAIAPGYLFSIPAASGSLTGANRQHLTLRLIGTRGHLTRFADRPVREAFAVANVDFARRFTHDFASSRPDAVLTYTPSEGQIPVSIGLAVGRPRWDPRHHTWTFSARRIRTPAANPPDSSRHTKPARAHPPRNFTGATLLIDDSEPCERGVIQPYADCEGADLAFVDLTDTDLTGVNFSGANLTWTNLTGADLTGADLTGADLNDTDLTESDLTGSDFAGADLSAENFIDADLHDADLVGADLAGAELPGVNLTGANLIAANLTNTDLTNTDLANTDLTDADVNGTDFGGARLCGAILPQGRFGGGC